MLWIWLGFIFFILFLLALDLGVFHRKAHEVTVREALRWSVIWIGMALLFGGFVYYGYEHHWLGLGTTIDAADGDTINGRDALTKYLTGYVVEKSLSVDNIFVIATLFAFFSVPRMYQHRVLFWGIIGALITRGAMIAVGSTLIARYHWLLYLFGAFLIATAIKMLMMKEGHPDPSQNVMVRAMRKFLPITDRFHGEHFIVTAGSRQSHEATTPVDVEHPDMAVDRAKPGTKMLTPLALALVTVEFTDVIFAVDSIPAVFAVTADPFIVFTSNVFAMLGLRSLYFALGGMLQRFKYLKVSLAVILGLIGVKMLAAHPLKLWLGAHFNSYVLGLVLLILVLGVIASEITNRIRRA